MANLNYYSGRTPALLAKKWGLSEQTVRNLACEASRVVREEVNRTDIRAIAILALQTIATRSMARKEMRTAVAAIQVLLGAVPAATAQAGGLRELLNAFAGEQPPVIDGDHDFKGDPFAEAIEVVDEGAPGGDLKQLPEPPTDAR